jgi:hypothetical protein
MGAGGIATRSSGAMEKADHSGVVMLHDQAEHQRRRWFTLFRPRRPLSGSVSVAMQAAEHVRTAVAGLQVHWLESSRCFGSPAFHDECANVRRDRSITIEPHRSEMIGLAQVTQAPSSQSLSLSLSQ